MLDELRAAVGRYGLTYGPDPATHSHNTLGGMIGNNSCGMHAQMAGKVEENILELDVLTYDGVRLTVGKRRPRNSTPIARKPAARARSIAACATFATGTPTGFASAFPIFRAASRATTSTNCCPKTDST